MNISARLSLKKRAEKDLVFITSLAKKYDEEYVGTVSFSQHVENSLCTLYQISRF